MVNKIFGQYNVLFSDESKLFTFMEFIVRTCTIQKIKRDDVCYQIPTMKYGVENIMDISLVKANWKYYEKRTIDWNIKNRYANIYEVSYE